MNASCATNEGNLVLLYQVWQKISPFQRPKPERCAVVKSTHGCQMAIARFLDHMCLALRASGLWLRYATLQNFIPSFPRIAPPRPPPRRNPRKGRDQILPSGNTEPTHNAADCEHSSLVELASDWGLAGKMGPDGYGFNSFFARASDGRSREQKPPSGTKSLCPRPAFVRFS